MKTISKSSGPLSLDAALIKPDSNILPFGSGYRQYLMAAASMDTEEPSGPLMKQPLRYLGAVEPMADDSSKTWQDGSTAVGQTLGLGLKAAVSNGIGQGETLSLRDAVIALRQKILIS